MSNFRTEIFPEKSDFSIDHGSKLVSMGSCFASTVGHKLQTHRFNIEVNPMGISFHPLVISQHLNNTINGLELNEDSIVTKGEHYVSFSHHSSIFAETSADLVQVVKGQHLKTFDALQDSNILLITWGTAWGYRHHDLDQVVANCHKAPQTVFSKELSDIQELVWSYKVVFKRLFELNQNLKIVLTVSPVRHWKDGAIENSRSKAHLLAAVHELVDFFDQVNYFPAYELMMDDLRDYRFYKEDMLHPSSEGVKYVWQKFSECFMTGGTIDLNSKIDQLNRSKNHQGPKDEALKQFIAKLEHEIAQAVPHIL